MACGSLVEITANPAPAVAATYTTASCSGSSRLGGGLNSARRAASATIVTSASS